MSKSQRRHAQPRTSTQGAFTRAELAALLAALTLVALVVLPALANSGPRTQRLTCVSNLREIGQALASWSSEFGNRLPMQVPYTEGGTLNHALANNAWFQFLTLSNHIRTSRILACPSDAMKRPAEDFTSNPGGGFLNVNYRNLALSYFIGHSFLESRPEILSADRNLTGTYLSGGCGYWAQPQAIPRVPSASVRWTAAIHNDSGNALFSDGRVEQLSSLALRQRLAEGASEAGTEFHYLTP